jgi:hypothetical protein
MSWFITLSLDEIIAVHKNMLDVAVDVTTGLEEAGRNSRALMTEQNSFAHAIKDFQSELLQDMVQLRNESESVVNQFSNTVAVAITSAMHSISQLVQGVETQYGRLHQVRL